MIFIHLVLAIGLFLIQNWIGGRAYAVGYVKFSLLDDKDEALAINYVIKVFGPVIFLILTVAIFQYLKLTELNQEIINVIYYYISIRLVLIIIYGRILIVNWFRILIYYLSVILIAKYTYENFLISITNLLPDFAQIKNEIWLLILVFLYQVGNGFEIKNPNNGTQEPYLAYLPELIPRKRRYILRRFNKFKELYGSTIDKISNRNEELTIVVISILIFENFNRPFFIRLVEKLWFNTLAKKSLSTTGIMQTKSTGVLNDEESVQKGTFELNEAYATIIKEEEGKDWGRSTFKRTIKRHCKDRMYVRQVLFICKAILDNKYEQADRENTFKNLYTEIKSEFSLYDSF
jgi:hypothetical protein